MSHNIENRDGVYSFAFTGERSNIWHRLGTELDASAGREEWLQAAGFDYHVEKVPAIASLNSAAYGALFLCHVWRVTWRHIGRQTTWKRLLFSL